ncbi:hypothetical protein EJB05_49691, partial [Eragrostis curvula]
MWGALPRRQGSSVSRRYRSVRPRRRWRRRCSSALVDPELYALAGAVVLSPLSSPSRWPSSLYPSCVPLPDPSSPSRDPRQHRLVPRDLVVPILKPSRLFKIRTTEDRWRQRPTSFPPPSRLPDLRCRRLSERRATVERLGGLVDLMIDLSGSVFSLDRPGAKVSWTLMPSSRSKREQLTNHVIVDSLCKSYS